VADALPGLLWAHWLFSSLIPVDGKLPYGQGRAVNRIVGRNRIDGLPSGAFLFYPDLVI
jgi:hypothetical protein